MWRDGRRKDRRNGGNWRNLSEGTDRDFEALGSGGRRGDEERGGSQRGKYEGDERRGREPFLCASQKLSVKSGIISSFFTSRRQTHVITLATAR